MSDAITKWVQEFLEKCGDKLTTEELDMLQSVPKSYQEYPNLLFQFLANIYPARLLEEALQRHAEALNRASEASDNYSKRLVIATWALVGVTFLLVCVTLLLVAIGIMSLNASQ
jgi:hypothetical protein